MLKRNRIDKNKGFDFMGNVPVDRQLAAGFQDDGFSLRAILLD